MPDRILLVVHDGYLRLFSCVVLVDLRASVPMPELIWPASPISDPKLFSALVAVRHVIFSWIVCVTLTAIATVSARKAIIRVFC